MADPPSSSSWLEKFKSLTVEVFIDGNEAAEPELRKCAKTFVRRRHWHHNQEDLDDIVNAAFAAALREKRDMDHLCGSKLFQALIRALERHKKRLSRDREAQHGELPPEAPDSSDAEALYCSHDLLEKLKDALADTLLVTIPELKPRDQVILIAEYQIGWLFPDLKVLPFPSELKTDSLRRATSRAKNRLVETMTAYLEQQVEVVDSDGDKEILGLALEAVKGQRWLKVFELQLDPTGSD